LKSSGQTHLIDIGGSFIKGAVANFGGVSKVHRFPVPEFKDIAGSRREVDIGSFVDSVKEMIHLLSTQYGEARATFFSGQMGGLVLMDRLSQEILCASSWQDQRSLDKNSTGGRKEKKSPWEMFTTLAFPDAFDSSGRDIKPGSQISQLYALKSDNPELFQRKPAAFTLLGYISNYFAGSLMNPVVHITDAASTGLFDVYNHRWNSKLIDLLSIKIELPRVTNDVCPMGTKDKTESSPFFSAIGDQQASLLGAGIERNRAIVNIGTGGQVAKLQNSLDGMRSEKPYQTRPFFHGKHLATVTHLPAGRLLAVLVEQSFGDLTQDSFQEFFRLSVGAGTVITLDPVKIISREINLKARNPDEIARSFLSLMVSSYGSALLKLGVQDIQQIVFAGGVAKEYEAFCQELSGFIGIPYEVSASNESTIEGLAKISRTLSNQGSI
jgi:xylulokinase